MDKIVALAAISLTEDLPLYKPDHTPEYAWQQFVLLLSAEDDGNINSGIQQLLEPFPYPSTDHWFPSWSQILRYPDVYLAELQLDDDKISPNLVDALKIRSGKMYRGCYLRRCGAGYVASDSTQNEISLEFCQGNLERAAEICPGISESVPYTLVQLMPLQLAPQPKTYSLLIVARELRMLERKFTKKDPHQVYERCVHWDSYKNNQWAPGKEFVCYREDTSEVHRVQYYLRRVTTLVWQHHRADELPFQDPVTLQKWREYGELTEWEDGILKGTNTKKHFTAYLH